MTNVNTAALRELPEPAQRPFYFCEKCSYMGEVGPSHIVQGSQQSEMCSYHAMGNGGMFTAEQMHAYAQPYAVRLAALEAGMRGLVEAVVEHTDHLARDSTCGLCAALHSAYALLNRPADGGE